MTDLFSNRVYDAGDARLAFAALTDDATAKILLKRYKSVPMAIGAPFDELALVAGRDVAERFAAVREVAKAFVHGEVKRRDVVSSWTALLAYLKVHMAWEPIEQFRILFLDKKNQIIADEVMGKGTVDFCPVITREIIKRALQLDASSMILAHNHPSGDPTPSGADIAMTKEIVTAAKALRITVHDHVVIGRDGVASLAERGLI
jgi:DNA repair protein RadC